MDVIISKQIDELIKEFGKTERTVNDPVAKLMVAALSYQAQKIKDAIDNIPEKIIDRLCDYFIPQEKIDAMPALCMVEARLKQKKDLIIYQLGNNVWFNYKINNKQQIPYYPLFANTILPFSKRHLLTPSFLKSGDNPKMYINGKKGQVWLGVETDIEIETLKNVSFLIKGTGGLMPQKISLANKGEELIFCNAGRMENLDMLYPFDAQQSDPVFFNLVTHWRNILSDSDQNTLVYIIDDLNDRDAFKCRAYPKVFQQYLESNDLDKFENNILWLLFDFGSNYEVPESIDIVPNVLPVVNVNINNVTLTQTTPIVKLTKDDGSYFLKVIETTTASKKQGFNMMEDDIRIKDFDSSAYDNDSLYRDVRNLYNRFVEDYYSFIEYNNLKDGELIKTLRETVNKIGRSVIDTQDIQGRFNNGVYAMRNINNPDLSSSIKVTFLTTFGKMGNIPKEGETMENKKDVALEKEIRIIVSAKGGENKATPDQKYEQLRYYLMTSDRLYTKMDIDAFLRLQLLKEYGSSEVKRINYTIKIEGIGTESQLVRGLYIYLTFKDEKNYLFALESDLDKRIAQQIEKKSCLSMPIKIIMDKIE